MTRIERCALLKIVAELAHEGVAQLDGPEHDRLPKERIHMLARDLGELRASAEADPKYSTIHAAAMELIYRGVEVRSAR